MSNREDGRIDRFNRGLTRRDFLKAAGATAGAAAVFGSIPGKLFAQKTGDAVFAASAIARPVFVCPAIVKTGSDIPFEKASGGATVESLWLSDAQSGEILALSLSGANALRPEKAAAPGIYDLFAKVSLGGKTRVERQPNAVKVVDGFKDDFVFGVISDVHFGDPRVKAKIPGFDVFSTFRKEIEILNERKVEFCLCCGDLCFLPPKSKNEIMDYAEELDKFARFPVYTVPGNHDGYATGAAGRIQFDTLEQWGKLFGPVNYLAQYGAFSLVGINTYDRPAAERNMYGGFGEKVDMGAMEKPQLEWLEKTLAGPKGATTVIFGHQNPTNTVTDKNGPFEVVPFSETGRKELLDLFEKYAPQYYFCGHIHGIFEETYAKTKIITVPTAGSLPADETHPIAIYVVHCSGGKIAKVETVEIARV